MSYILRYLKEARTFNMENQKEKFVLNKKVWEIWTTESECQKLQTVVLNESATNLFKMVMRVVFSLSIMEQSREEQDLDSIS